ncbi:50S ribosomal protein L31e [Candidatus Micrarchaeota archaeon]|nr:50S ribosomal protein L31e [Candidatus Micrarchaeota archaeon]
MVLERIYTIPLGDAYEVPRNKRGKRAVNLVKSFILRHMKAKDERLTISMAINSYILKYGIEKPPRRVKVRAIKEDGSSIKVYMSDELPSEEKKGSDKKETKADEKKEGKGGEKKTEPKKEEAKKEEKTEAKKEKLNAGQKA